MIEVIYNKATETNASSASTGDRCWAQHQVISFCTFTYTAFDFPSLTFSFLYLSNSQLDNKQHTPQQESETLSRFLPCVCQDSVGGLEDWVRGVRSAAPPHYLQNRICRVNGASVKTLTWTKQHKTHTHTHARLQSQYWQNAVQSLCPVHAANLKKTFFNVRHPEQEFRYKY